MKVRHPQFGIGTVLSVEALDDDTKLVGAVRQHRPEDAASEVRAAGTGMRKPQRSQRSGRKRLLCVLCELRGFFL